jgi:PTH1 family peptidyl-tRNA hydrolase
VLGRFTREEEAALPEIQARVADAVDLIVREGFAVAMNRYNAPAKDETRKTNDDGQPTRSGT